MADRGPHTAPRRGDAGGALIRWTVILMLGAASVALARNVMTAEANRSAEAVHAPLAASPPQFFAPQMVDPATGPDTLAADENVNAGAPAEPDAAATREAAANHKFLHRPPHPESESEPTPVVNFPTTPTVGAEPLAPSVESSSAAQAAVADPPLPSASSSPAPASADEAPPPM